MSAGAEFKSTFWGLFVVSVVAGRGRCGCFDIFVRFIVFSSLFVLLSFSVLGGLVGLDRTVE